MKKQIQLLLYFYNIPIIISYLLLLILFSGSVEAKKKYLNLNYSFKPEQKVKWPEDTGLLSNIYEIVDTTPKKTPHSHSWVNDIVRDGKYAIKLEIHGNECGGNDCSRRDHGNFNGNVGRTEFGFFKKKHPGENWFRWSMYVPKNTSHIDGYTMLNQFKTDTNADINDCPTIPLYFKLGNNGIEISREIGGCGPNVNWDNNKILITYDENFRGKWLDFIVHAKWSNKEDGFVYLWVNGEMRYNFEGTTIHPQINNYDKFPPVPRFGIYNGKRRQNSTDKQVIYYDAFYIAKTCKKLKLDTLGYSCDALTDNK